VLFGVGLYVLGPIAWSLALYFVVAPLVARGRPIRLVDKLNELPGVGTAHGSVDVTLQAKERMLVRERFLDAVTDGLKRRTRFLLDWRWPFTWSASGLAKLVELKNPHPLREYGCTLTDRSNPHGELTVVTLRSGVRMVVRPSFIAAVVLGEGERLRVRRRWQLFRWQPWIARQFRFLEFQGPCRLVIAGHRGVRAEWLMDRGGRPNPARRATHDAAIGFTPNLNYQPIRAETFWSYHQGMNPLFDELFSGHGLFLCQGLPGEGSVRPARRFWSKARTGALKVFGL
jgi:hypothetical protein